MVAGHVSENGPYNNRVDVLGREYVFGPTLRRAKNIFTPKNINSITIIMTSEGI